MSILPGSCDTITIDEEFRAHCPPLTETERQILRQDIERSGLLSPLIVWNHEGRTILVDGHIVFIPYTCRPEGKSQNITQKRLKIHSSGSVRFMMVEQHAFRHNSQMQATSKNGIRVK